MIKRIDIKEFRERGYLQELNRRFLHPLGLALEVVINEETGEETLGGIWDYRDDPEGIHYDLKNSDENRREKFEQNRLFISNEIFVRGANRIEKLGFDIEPIKKK